MIKRLKIESCSISNEQRDKKKESGKKKKNPRMEKWTADKEGGTNKRARRTKDNEGERVGLT